MRNKGYICVVLFWSSLSIASSNSGTFELETYNQHQKLIERHLIELKENAVVVDGATLSITETSVKAKLFKKLIIHNEGKYNQCDSGIYKYNVKYNEHSFTENNCLASKRYVELKQLFEAMKKNMVLIND